MRNFAPRMAALAALGAALTFACSAPSGPGVADLILTGGRIVTLDPDRPEVAALAARDGRVVALGGADEIARLRGPDTRVVELDGRLAVPGFIEGHAHFPGLGDGLATVDLRGAASWEEVVERVRVAAEGHPPGAWIVGRGWHQEKWERPPSPAVEGYPVHDALSAALPDRPVALTHASGHAVIVNAAALHAAGIDDSTPDPAGGQILRNAAGEPTGVLRETAEELAWSALAASEAADDPAARRERARRRLALANDECLRNGITSFQDAGSSLAEAALMRELVEAGEIDVRLWVMLSSSNEELEAGLAAARVIGAADDRFTVRAIKRWLDGALGSHGAWLLEPYEDLPGSTGLNTVPIAELERTAEIALEHDVQLCVHAIGDRANREALDVFERAFATAGDGPQRRWRIEHAQHVAPADVPRFAELGVIASIQSVHCTSDGPWVPARIGEERARAGAYVWRDLLDAGAVLSNGTDAPVEPIDPIANFHAAVTRRMADGRAFHPGQALSRTQALRSMTLDAAYAAFEEDVKGSLSPGKLADVVVLSEDILTVPEERIREARVTHTIVGGDVVWEAAP